MRLKPLDELGTIRDVNLTIASELDSRVPHAARIVVPPIAVDDERE